MWEEIEDPANYSQTHRMRLEGGWLVRTVVIRGYEAGVAVAHTFVLDPDHNWELEKLPAEPTLPRPVGAPSQ